MESTINKLNSKKSNRPKKYNTKKKLILVACEESQRVCIAFRNKGHTAYSCDIKPCSGNHPEWHINKSVLEVLNGNCFFRTQDGKRHAIKREWDMIIAFPPCTHLAVSGRKYFEEKRESGVQREALIFFGKILKAKCKKICIENPIGIATGGEYMQKYYPDLIKKYKFRKYSQIIQPWMFGEPYQKSTCLWLKGLPLLKPTNILERPETGWLNQEINSNNEYVGFKDLDENGKYYRWNSEEVKTVRSRTYNNIALAMADQWG